MRVLHLGSGFRPLRRGGLVAYIEDLMAEQVRRGDEVAYFFAGRHYPRLRTPRIRRWSRDDVSFYELVNSPLHDHGRQPALEVAAPVVDVLLEEAIDEFRPDVVHLQELAGLPSSVIDVARGLGLPVVVTLQDYFFVCPTFKLLDAAGRTCDRHDPGAGCLAAAAADPRPAGMLFEATANHDLAHAPLLHRLPRESRERIARVVGRRAPPTAGPQGTATDFRRRREANVERLSRADVVIAMSERVAELHVELGVAAEKVRTVHLTLAHIDRLTPAGRRGPGRAPTARLRRERPGRGGPHTRALRREVVFGTLGAFEFAPKGGDLLLDAVRLLDDSPAAGRFRVLVFGWVEPRYAEAAAGLDAIEIRDPFAPSELDAILDGVDVGLMPSVWEEAYGFAGVEFLAKGIPVVANAIGGMPDYVREGETGWLNRSCEAEELAAIMGGIVERPEQVADLNAKLRADRETIIKPIARHADEMDAIYAEAIAGRRRS